ncbi:MAG: hypothetical protein OEY20_02485, partial [Gemmatimonadota bacterium]|nr:hypothetical protein [Gemmatimonadota bacterium]
MTGLRWRGVAFVRWSEEAAPRTHVGGKAFQLQALTRLGMPVPRWFVLTTGATDAILGPVRGEIAALARCVEWDSESRGYAARIVACIRTSRWPAAVRAALLRAVEQLGGGRPLAVRSSAVEEDGRSGSYAGMFESRLGLPPDAVEAAVRECLAAGFAERVVAYRRERGERGAWPRLAIVIQEMATTRVAGVAFSADPRTGEPREIVVAGYGLGAGVVGDLVEADSFERAPGDGHWSSTVRSKRRRVVPDGAGGLALAEVAPEERERPALSADELDRLFETVQRIERAFGGPQDVEWAIADDGELRLLQARPISTIPAAVTIWDDSNIGESYPGVTLPLTFSLVRRTYEQLFTRALAEIGVGDDTLRSLGPELRHLIGIVDGHLYMNLLAYYQLFAAAPGIGWTVAKWEEALGIRDAPAVRDAGRADGAWIRRAALAVRVWLRLARRFRGIDAEVARFGDEVEEMLVRFDGEDLARWSFDRLLARFHWLEREYLDRWTVLIFNDLFAFLFNDRLGQLCAAVAEGGGSGLHQRLLVDLDRAASLRPLQALREVAGVGRGTTPVAQSLWSDLPARQIWDRLRQMPAASAFRSSAAAYLARYGDRTVEELKLETVPPSEEPWTIVDLLRAMPEGNARSPHGTGAEGEARLAAERELRSRWAGRPLHRWYAAWVLRRTRRLLAARENLSFARARAYGLLRRLVRAMGAALVREGTLAESDDICYATFEDLEGHLRGGLPGDRLAASVTARRTAYAAYRALRPPHRIVCRGSVYRPAVAEPRVAAS